MFPQTARITGCIITQVAFVWLFSAVHFHMCPQTACPEYTLSHRLLFFTFQSLDPSLVQIWKRKERDSCSIWTRLMYFCYWPLVLSYSKLKEWKWNSSGVDGEGLLCGKHQVQEAGDQSAAAAIHLQHSITHTWTCFYYEHGSILITTIGEAKQSEVCKQPHESLQRVPRIGEEIMRLFVRHEILQECGVLWVLSRNISSWITNKTIKDGGVAPQVRNVAISKPK